MKRSYIYLFGLILTVGLIFMSACEEKIPQNYTPYDPAVPEKFSYPDAVFYPELKTLSSDTPVINSQGVYVLDIDTVHMTEDGKYLMSKFKIDNTTGVISYDNAGGSINPGVYTVDISLYTVNSKLSMPGAYTMTIQDVPLSAVANPDEYNAGALEAGIISKIETTDETGDGSIVIKSYALNPAVNGFSVDENGNIKKTTLAPVDTTVQISVKITTNLGAKTFNNILTVHIGAPPTLVYKKSDGSTTLNKVTMSPHTKYVSAVPELTDMNADGGWELYSTDETVTLPVGFSVDQTTGVITIDAETNLIEDGTYSLGIKVTNASGVSFDFGKQFDVVIHTDWDNASEVYSQYFQDNITNQPLEHYPELKGYDLAGTGEVFKVAHWVISNKNSEFFAMKLFDGSTSISANTVALLNLEVKPEWVALKVSFNDFFGYGTAALNGLERTLSYSYSNSDLESGAYDPTNWHVIIPADGDWAMSSGWGNDKTDADFHQVPAVELTGFDYTQSNVYINWHFNFTDPATKGQYFIDALKVVAAKTYIPVEE